MPTLTTRDGTRLFARRWGAGPPMLFLHGWSMSSEIWQPAMAIAVRAGFEAIGFDRRSHGRSDDPGRGYDYDTLADDVADVFEAFDLKGLTVVTHSMGAGEIVRYLGRHGDARVERIVMVAPALPFLLKTPDNPDGPREPAGIAELHRVMAEGRTEWLGPAVAAAYGPGASPDRVRHTLRIMLECTLHAAIEVDASVAGTDFRRELERIATPTLVLHGDADQSAPLQFTGARLPALMPSCRLKVYPGGDHTMVAGKARQIVEDTLAFIQATSLALAEA